MSKPFIDITGKRFGLLFVKEWAGEGKWRCLCDCGCVKAIGGKDLRYGKTVSCGCYRRSPFWTRTHGMSGSREYKCWRNAIDRCYYPSSINYARYGGRGIQVCDSWKHSFSNFYRDMGPCPDGYTLDRIDIDGDYCQNNCRWATATEQVNNRRNTIRINGIPLGDLARRNDITYKQAYYLFVQKPKLQQRIAV